MNVASVLSSTTDCPNSDSTRLPDDYVVSNNTGLLRHGHVPYLLAQQSAPAVLALGAAAVLQADSVTSRRSLFGLR